MKNSFIRKRCFCFLLLLVAVFSADVYSFETSISFDEETRTSKSKISIRSNPSNEGILLHIANRKTSLGMVFFKAYLLKDSSLNAEPSKDLHLQVIDDEGQVIINQLHKFEGDTVEGAINIPDGTPAGKYSVKAYTNRMLQRHHDQFVEQSFYLIDHKAKSSGAMGDSIKINIEGGTFVSGEKNRIVVYFPRKNQSSAFPKGELLDDEGNFVSAVIMYSEQIGTAVLKPILGKSYFLRFEDGRLVALPKPANEGYLLQVNNLDSKVVKVRIIRSSNILDDPVWLNGRMGGKEFFSHDVNWTKNTATINIDKRLLPTGILTLRLNNNEGQVHTMRPIFVHSKQLNVTFESINDSNTKNPLRIITTDSVGPISSKLAMSINKYDSWPHLPQSLYSVVVPSSRKEKNSAEGTQNQSRSKNFIKDLYLQIEYGKNETNVISNNDFFEQIGNNKEGIEITAHVYDLNNNLLENTPIQVFIKSDGGISILEVQSDSQGFIEIQNLDFTGTAEFTFRTEGSDTKSRLVKAIPVKKETRLFNSPNLRRSGGKENEMGKDESIGIYNDTTGLIVLEEAVVEEKRINRIKGVKSIYGIEIPGKRVKYQDAKKPKSLAQLLREMPGVYVTNEDGTDLRVNIPRLKDPVLWVIDGYALPQDFDGRTLGYPMNSLLPVLEVLRDEDIDRIDLLIGADASIFGTRASGGVFSITTRSGAETEYINRKEARLFVKGYEPKIDFETYMNQLSKREKEKSTLLYWNPTLETDEKGQCVITLSTIPKDLKDLRINYSTSFQEIMK